MSTWNEIEARQAHKEREQRAALSLFNALPLHPTEQQEQRVLSLFNQFGAECVQMDRQQQEADLREKLEKLGISITIAHYTGDSSYPTEYTLRHGEIQARGSTLDLALVAFLERLLPGRK